MKVLPFLPLILFAFFLSGFSVQAQTTGNQGGKSAKAARSSSASESVPIFRSESRMVVVDVVATGQDGKPIAGLNKDDFEVLENGKPQQVEVFEPHVPAKQLTAVPEIRLPPDQYTNFPKQAANSAINVVLFDILNTPTEDQMFARKQMVEFLKTLPRGQRVALFTLGYDLHMVAGFTTSTDELIAAAQRLSPGVSPLLDTEADMESEDHVGKRLNSGESPSNCQGGGGTGGPLGRIENLSRTPPGGSADRGGCLGMAQEMADFLTEDRLVRTDLRVEKTFEAMGALARALSGYTGRKNILWLSEAFPANVLPNREDSRPNIRNYLAVFQQYSGLLESSQISVYPIDLRSLKNLGLQPATGDTESHSLARQDSNAIGSQLLMRDIAEQTGGKAFYNTNDLKGALRKGMENGATYYTLAYVPQNHDWNGAFRHIAVKLDRPDTTLAYRRGYYALRDDPSPAETARRMLIAEMQPGVPESTMLLLRVKVTPPAGKNDKVAIDYGVYAPDITFTGDDVKQAKLEFVAVAWDKNNKASGDASETMNLNLKPETFKKILNTGVPAHEELNLKPGAYKLRLGVMDYSNSKIGTLEIPLTVPDKEPVAPK
jgi:VWFA-related protein